MSDPTYSFRLNRLTPERQYRLSYEALEWTDARNRKRSVPYADFYKIRFYKARWLSFLGKGLKRRWRCALYSRTEKKIILTPSHYVDAETREGRGRAFGVFIAELWSRIAAANPNAILEEQRRPRIYAAVGRIFVWLLRAARRVPLHSSAAWSSRFLRTFGPWLPSHRTARRNLRLAFPDKTSPDIERIIDGMWGHLGRVSAELAHLDQILDHSRIEVDQRDFDRFLRIRDGGKPVLFFAAHLANWELPAVWSNAHGLDLAALFLKPRFEALADELLRLRAGAVGRPIPADGRAGFRLATAMKRGTNVVMLVDNYERRGIEIMFFGQRTKVSPALARFARLFDCPIYGGRAIRLADNQYRLELTGPIDAPRDPDGQIDIVGTMQMIMGIIEGWIRDQPEQWRWYYRWWR